MNYKLLKDNLRKHEGYREKPYTDTEGHLTIGIGHNLETGLDPDVIEHQFSIDIERAISDCTALYPNWTKIPDNKQAVIAELMFNMGMSTLKTFKRFRRAVLAEDWDEAKRELINSKWHSQVGQRAIYLENLLIGEHG